MMPDNRSISVLGDDSDPLVPARSGAPGTLTIRVKRLTETAKLPTKAHEGDAGWDLFSGINIHIDHGNTILIPTGIAVEIPAGYFGLILGRSSLSADGIDVLGGVIDHSYRGEVKAIVHNGSPWGTYWISVGDRIAQMVILPVPAVRWEEVQELDLTIRGHDGFGSTGR